MDGIRREIQALRAVAVGVVVGWHLWPHALPGGFVGVDVFFVISGFLITSLLLREVERDGGIGLRGFWARRARRILPAALTVLAATTLATVAFVPVTEWSAFLGDVRASTFYIQNWHLAARAVDYFHATDAPSPLQHFWSLAVEEQFYVVWPLVLGLVATRARRLLPSALLILVLASFLYGLIATAHDPAAAYFATTTRAWELGAGALLATLTAATPRLASVARPDALATRLASVARPGPLATRPAAAPSPGPLATRPAAAPSPGPLATRPAAAAPRPATFTTRLAAALAPARPRPWLTLAGLAAIGAAVFTYTSTTAFPGAAALLPVAGALAVIAGGPSLRVLALPPVQWLGDVSYAVYLWHWPLIVFAPYALGHAPDLATKLGIVALTLALAALSKAYVEDPVRHRRRSLRVTFAGAAASSLAVVALTGLGTAHVDAQVRASAELTARTLAHEPPCFGATARDARHTCHNAKLAREVVPTPVQAPKLDNGPCHLVESRGRVRACAFGAPAGPGVRTVALIGDSHASHWRAALQVVARRKGWHGLSVTHSGCPFSAATAIIPEPGRTECVEWKRDVRAFLARHPEIDTVFFGEHTGGTVVVPHGSTEWRAQVKGYENAWRALPQRIHHILILRDNPHMRTNTLDCVQRALEHGKDAGRACAQPRDRALERDPAAVAAAHVRRGGVQTIDLTHLFCDPRRCFPVIGGALVYKDVHHLTAVFSGTLGPYVARRVNAYGLR